MRNLRRFFWLGPIFALAAAAFLQAGVVQRPGEDYLAFEAESADAMAQSGEIRWGKVSDADASGGEALFGEGDSLGVPGGIATYQIRFSTPGSYVLYTRWKADAATAAANPFSANSFSYARGFGTEPEWVRSRANERSVPESLEFAWSEETARYEVTEEDVAAGTEFVFLLGTRESGIILDRVVFKQGPAQTSAALDTTVNAPDESLAPRIVSAAGGEDLESMVLNWSVPLAPLSSASFAIEGLEIESATLDPADASRVILRTDQQNAGADYTLLVNGVRGMSGAPIKPNTSAVVQTVRLRPGWAKLVSGEGGELVQWLERFQFESPAGATGEIVLSAFFVPSEPGRYGIYVRNSGPVELTFWRDSEEANALGMVRENPEQSFGETALLVTPILAAGQSYLLSARMTGGAGPVWLAAAARKTGEAGDLLALAGSEIASFIAPAAANLMLAEEPQDRVLAGGGVAEFSVSAAASLGPIYYQWQRNGVDVPGAVAPSYTTPVLAVADSGTRYQVVVKAAGQVLTSREAVVTVNPGKLRMTRSGVKILWDAGAAGTILETSDQLGPKANWKPVPGKAPISSAGEHVAGGEKAGFYRLRK